MSGNFETGFHWDLGHEVSKCVNWDVRATQNTLVLLEESNTIPFIARYRKEKTGNMDADKIREVKERYEELQSVRKKVTSAMKSIDKLGKLTEELKRTFHSARTMTEVEHLYAPFNQGSKASLAERAKELGLETLARNILANRSVDLRSAVQSGKKGVSTLAEVEKGVQCIIADILSKDKDTMDTVRHIYQNANILIEVSKRKQKQTDEKGNQKTKDEKKYERFYQFSCPLARISHCQVLAINRGESVKALSIKFNIPQKVQDKFRHYCERNWIKNSMDSQTRNIILKSVDDANKRLIEPYMIRHFRSDLTKNATKSSIDVFAKNLKRLLLVPPVRGRVVLGVDPGFRFGCKFAVISKSGNVLDTGVAYLHTNGSKTEREVDKIKRVLLTHRCETVAIGNGTGCRETETFFASHISKKTFKPLQVEYCIVNESGASVYSASKEGIKEFPDLDVSLRGAVSIARRLQDPLAELVKIEPKHIGVGMYQHDCPESQLKTSLDSVTEECVSFTGVDINSCSEFLLRKIAGLSAVKVQKIIEYREKNNGFMSREELRHIKGLGPKSFEQCAGFVRVLPETRRKEPDHSDDVTPGLESASEKTKGKKRKSTKATSSSKSKKAKMEADCVQVNALDMTSIHPESYHIADRLMSKLKLQKEDIGQDNFIKELNVGVSKFGMQTLADELEVGLPTVSFIVVSLQQKIGHDIREEFEKPLFKKDILSIDDISPGCTVTGKVTNVTSFGAFVDIGINRDGLVYWKNIPHHLRQGNNEVGLGDKVEVKVNKIVKDPLQIDLILLKVL